MEEKIVITVDHVNSIRSEPKKVVLRDGIEICIKPELTMQEFVYVVNNAASACFDFGRGVYYPEAEEYMFRVSVIEAYTNIGLPDDVETAYKYVGYIWDDVRDAIDSRQFKNLKDAVKKSISFSKDDILSRRQKELGELVERVTGLCSALSEAFSGVNVNELSDLASSLEVLSGTADAEFSLAVMK